MMLFSLILLVATISLFAVVESAPFKCPGKGKDPKKIDVSKKKIVFRKSTRSTLCTLVHIRHADPSNTSEVTITNNSPATDYILTPVARSYNKNNWETSAGAFSTKFKVKKCKKTKCVARFSEKGTYFLMTYNHSLPSFKEELSRLFMQTTFGPTKDMLNSWSYPQDMDGITAWVRDQMDLPPTIHREYLLKHADTISHNNTIRDSGFAVQHPCAPNSRWRGFAFASYDNSQEFNVQKVGSSFLISLNGEPRTLVQSFQSNDDDVTYSGEGLYQFCWLVADSLGGAVQFRPKGSTGSCYYLDGGNPPVVLTKTLIDLFGTLTRVIDLPEESNFEAMSPQIPNNRGDSYPLLEHMRLKLPNGLYATSATQCSALNDNYQFIIGKLPDSPVEKYFLYSGLATPMQNTIENPLPDGGMAAVNAGGRMCTNVAKTFRNIESCFLQRNDACQSSAYGYNEWDWQPNIVKNAVICGSDGEIGYDGDVDASQRMFTLYGHDHNLFRGALNLQAKSVAYTIFMNENDQLRQRMAFALSQILVITSNQIDNDGRNSEIYLNYYDIFVRNAFGNYRDILKEVSYSPMMAEMLSFLDSKSASYVLQTEGRISRPDENYAREIMQLFSIGLNKLKIDGSTILSDGEPVSTYQNSDIQTFARAWTGFRRQQLRSNREGYYYTRNRMDPMAVEGRWRDPFPKLDLEGGFIGDGYPLCPDLPDKHFLRRGATYRLIGSARRAELFYENPYHNYTLIERFPLDSESRLYQKLCNADQAGTCDYRSLVHLSENLVCFDRECGVDNLGVVLVEDDVKYEYVRPACVDHSFHKDLNLKKVVSRYREAMCLNDNIDDVAMPACCASDDPGSYLSEYADYNCDFSFEKSSYGTTQSRCQSLNLTNYPNADTCDWMNIRLWTNNENIRTGCNFYSHMSEANWHWTNQTCSIMAKVNDEGMVSIVHDPNLDINVDIAGRPNEETLQHVYQPVNPENMNYFKVQWSGTGDYPRTENQCANDACQNLANECLCSVEVNESRVFSEMPSKNDIISNLNIGHAPPDSYDAGIYTLVQHNEPDVIMYQRTGESQFNKKTVFGVEYRGKITYFKNVESIVEVAGDTGVSAYQFRNPPQFLNIGKPDTRDTLYETDAVLDHYFYHSNTAPFLATRLIKRFGISNPSPRYISTVAQAFKTGTYNKLGVAFGDGNYGNLEAMAASIVLDSEARSVSLDADPSTGSLREPLIKVISFLRAMEYKKNDNVPAVMMQNLQDFIGQEIHATPNVFSFFLPEYSPNGKVADASLTSPESQVLDSPKITGFLNGVFALIDIGMTSCYGGLGDLNTYSCNSYKYYTPAEMNTRGYLTFSPSNFLNGAQLVDEVSLLLTGGRLNSITKAVIIEAYNRALYNNGAVDAVKAVQKLVLATPEYHSTNVFESINSPRPELPLPQPSAKPYKAIVYLNLDGGFDSYNFLVPHSDCQGDTAEYTMFDEYKLARGDIALAKNSLQTIDATSSGQICNTFGLHESVPFIKSLYDNKDLSFVANIGVLQQYVTKENWRTASGATQLFAHNIQQEEINFMDIFDDQAGRGVCGRMLDILGLNGFKPGSISVNGIANSLRARSSPSIVLDSSGYQKFNPTAPDFASEVLDKVKEVNTAASIRSSLFGETWSNALFQTLGENELMYEELTNTFANTTFPDTDLGRQLETVAKVMKTKDVRGTDRDIFNVRIGGFDMHSQIEAPLIERLTTINDGLEAFVTEMKDYQGIWDNVAVVVVSEFARTLLANTGNGSDHAWGGHYFLASGSLDGGKILGSFPTNLTNEGDLAFEPGIVLPTSPWESLWNGLAQWFGITSNNDLTTVLPNRNTFQDDLWTESDLFRSSRRRIFKHGAL